MFLLHLTYPSGAVQTVSCSSAFVRALWIVSLAAQPIAVRCEDVAAC